MRLLSNSAILPVTAGVLLALLLAVAAVQWTGNRTVPPQFQYLLPGSNAYLVTGPLKDLWRHGPVHLARLRSKAASSAGEMVMDYLDHELNRACLKVADLGDLDQLGIDGERSLSFSFIDAANAVVAIPLSDRERFTRFLERIASPGQLVLSAHGVPGKLATALRIDANRSQGIQACESGHGTLIDLAVGETVTLPNWYSPEVHLAVFRTQEGKIEVGLNCTAIYTDQTTGPCSCQFNGEDCSRRARRWEPLPQDWPLMSNGDTAILMSNEQLAKQLTSADWLSKLLLGNARVKAAIQQGERNLRWFRGDDSFLAAIELLSELGQAGDGVLVGAFVAPVLPLSGRVHFALHVDDQQLTSRVLLPWQTLHSTFLKQVVAPPREPTTGDLGSFSREGEVVVDDPALGQYLRFGRLGTDEQGCQFLPFGNFAVFLQEISQLDQVGRFQLAFAGIRDGVPDLVMALGVPAAEAELLLLRQRVQIRQMRDRQILWAAAREFHEADTTKSLSDIKQLLSFVESEPAALWTRYEIGEQDLLRDFDLYGEGIEPGHDANPAEPVHMDAEDPSAETEDAFTVLAPPASRQDTECDSEILRKAFPMRIGEELTSDDFAQAEYETVRDGRRFLFLAPPITEDDLKYRVNRGNDGAIDKTALQAGRFRMAAYVDEANDRLIVASDIKTLAAAVAKPIEPEDDGERRMPPSSKLSVFGDPQFLIMQGLLYPDDSVGAVIRDYMLDFEQYRRMNMHIELLPSGQGINATVVLSRE